MAKQKKVYVMLRVFGFLICTIAALEIMTRAFLYLSLSTYLNNYIPNPYRERMKHIHLFHPVESSWCKFDPLCYFLPKEGLFRGPGGQVSYPREKREQEEIRIICIGNSTTYGDAVDYDNSWPYLLERLLRKHYHKNIKVLNAGLPAASPRQLKRIYQLHLANYDHDIVIWKGGFGLSDPYEIPVISSHLRMFLWRGLFESRIFRVMCILNDRKKGNPYVTADAVYDFIVHGGQVSEDIHTQFASDFSNVKRIAAEHATKCVLAVDDVHSDEEGNLYPNWDRQDEEGYIYTNWVRQVLSPTVVTLGAFTERINDGLTIEDIFVDNMHLTEVGTSIIAQEIFKFLVAARWIENIQNECGRSL